ncbi:hypothetical protein LINPERHAP1_LOCUS14938, partial [Linum perenne]
EIQELSRFRKIPKFFLGPAQTFLLGRSFLPAPLRPASQPLPSRSTVWTPPPFPKFKINVDGALSAGLGGASGLVVQDHLGGLLFATVDIEGDATEVMR